MLQVPGTHSKPAHQFTPAALGKASVASERPPEGGHAASRQRCYPKPHPAALPQATPSRVTPSHIQPGYPDPHPAALPQPTSSRVVSLAEQVFCWVADDLVGY